MEELVLLAAENNAKWCELVCRIHGVPCEWRPGFWRSLRPAPRLYPEAVTLRPYVSTDELLPWVQLGRGCSIKDSFATLNLESRGFEELFEGQWIYLEPSARTDLAIEGWTAVETEDDMAEWSNVAGLSDVLHPALTRDATVRIMQRKGLHGVDAGAVANRTESVVGISNVFSIGASPDEVWPDVVAAIAHEFPSVPVVGYEHGEDLQAALDAGFQAIGRLRVWLQTQDP